MTLVNLSMFYRVGHEIDSFSCKNHWKSTYQILKFYITDDLQILKQAIDHLLFNIDFTLSDLSISKMTRYILKNLQYHNELELKYHFKYFECLHDNCHLFSNDNQVFEFIKVFNQSYYEFYENWVQKMGFVCVPIQSFI